MLPGHLTVLGLITRCILDTTDGETVAIQGLRILPDSVYPPKIDPRERQNKIANQCYHLSNDEIANPPRVIDAHYRANAHHSFLWGLPGHNLLFRFN